jgi:hypothetical protein
MRIAVRVVSLLGLGVHLLFILILGAASGSSDLSSSVSGGTIVLLGSPFVYFGYCLLSSFGHWRKVSLLITGIPAHLCIIPFLIRLIHDDVWFFGIPIAVMAYCWVAMVFESEKNGNGETAHTSKVPYKSKSFDFTE